MEKIHLLQAGTRFLILKNDLDWGCLKFVEEIIKWCICWSSPYCVTKVGNKRSLDLLSQQIYNADELGLLLPDKTLGHSNETTAPGRKSSKERTSYKWKSKESKGIQE